MGNIAYIRGRGSSQQDPCPWGHLSTWGARWNSRDVFPRVQGQYQVRSLWIGRGSSMINPKGNSDACNIWSGDLSCLDDLSVQCSRRVSEEAVEDKEVVSV